MSTTPSDEVRILRPVKIQDYREALRPIYPTEEPPVKRRKIMKKSKSDSEEQYRLKIPMSPQRARERYLRLRGMDQVPGYMTKGKSKFTGVRVPQQLFPTRRTRASLVLLKS